MTVSTTVRKAGPFTGNDVTTAFPFAFRVFADTDVLVVTALLATGAETTAALNVDYTVVVNADQDASPGGTVTMLAALPSTKSMVITSQVPQTQGVLVTNAGGFFPKVFNAAFDRAVILVQQLAEKISRTITIPITAAGVTSLQIPVLAGGVIQWKPDGTGLQAVTLPNLALSLALPNMAGKGGQFLSNDGAATALWTNTLAAFSPIGGATAAFPALKRNGAGIDVRLADDSGPAAFSVGALAAVSGAFSGAVTAATVTAVSGAFSGAVTAATVAAGNVREKLTANRTYFVDPAGNDTNTGLSGAAPFLTVQKGLDMVSALDLNGFVATVSVADGTYAGAALLSGQIPGQKTAAQVVIQGNLATPANVIFSLNTATPVITAQYGALLTARGARFNSAGSNAVSLQAVTGGQIEFDTVDFGLASTHCYARTGGQITAIGNYTISGSAGVHTRAEIGGRVRLAAGITVTLTGGPVWGTAFAYAPSLAVQELSGVTFSGAATGPRYSAAANGAIITNGGGASYLPGNSAGSTATGGQYV